MEIDEETKKNLLEMLANAEESIPEVRKAIERGSLTCPYSKTFCASRTVKLPSGKTLDGVTIVLGKEVRFHFFGNC